MHFSLNDEHMKDRENSNARHLSNQISINLIIFMCILPKWEIEGFFYRTLDSIKGQDQTTWTVLIKGEIESSTFNGVEWDEIGDNIDPFKYVLTIIYLIN